MSKSISCSYDEETDTAKIEGIEWSGEFLRTLRQSVDSPEEIPPYGYVIRMVQAPNAVLFGIRYERVKEFEKLVEKAEDVYRHRGEIFEDPNSVHRKILILGHYLNEARGLK